MKVVKIVPGSGGTFYCENCLRDSALTKALRALGHDVMLVPMYLPMFTDEPDLTRDVPVFFGGINVFLQQKLRLFRHTPRWVDRLFDARWLLRLAARREGSTSAAGMGAMTLSMIRGEEGHQAKELERLVAWLAESEQPDLVHISTSMLIGVARRIRKALNVPVVCTLQDEDTWLDAVDPPYDARCWEAIRERAAEIDAFVAVSDAYARHMRGRLRIPDGRLNVVHVGIDLAGYTRTDLPFDPPVLGYLSKLTPSLGLGELVETFMRLKRKPGLERLQLRAIGGLTGNDTRFVEELRGRLAAAGMAQDASFKPEVDKPARLRFLSGITVMCVPMPQGEAFGTFMVEAWASGVPVVQPDAGAFPELIALTGGGVTYDPAGPEALDGALESLLRDPDRARALGLAGREKTPSLFSIDVMARKIEKVYHETLKHRNKEERS